MPLLLVVAVALLDPAPDPVKDALAPVVGALKVTTAPLTGCPPLSVTVACRALVNAVLTTALCEAPALALMLPAPPDAFNARRMVATCGVPAPPQVAAYEPVALTI